MSNIGVRANDLPYTKGYMRNGRMRGTLTMSLKLFCALGAIALVAFGSSQSMRRPSLSAPLGPKNEIVAGRLLVKLKPQNGKPAPIPKSLAGLPAGSSFVNSLQHMGWTLWSIPRSVDPRKAALSVRSNPAVSYAEPVNKVYLLVADPNDYDYGVQETETTNPDVVLDLSGDSNPSFTRLWHLDESFARAAWDVYPGLYYTSATKPANPPMIAIIDSGCDQNHPDFINSGGSSTNTALGGQLNWALSAHFSAGAPDGASWDDDNGHGTHVTGLAVAAANNLGFFCHSAFGIPDANHGVPGTGYNAQAMILKVIDQTGSGTDTDAAAAILYAADHGADIINLSLGTANYSQVFQDAVTYAWQKGSLVVAAGNENGNGGGNLGPIYPAACSGALGVTADGPNWAPATGSYSGYGSYVDIAAPGGDLIQDPNFILIQFIFSTAMRVAGGPGSLYDLSNGGTLYPPYDLDYAYLAGTSMATPQVSGAAALYYGRFGLRQGQGHVNIRAYRALEKSAQSVAGAANGSWEPVQGYGVLDAFDLLSDADSRGATVGSIEGIVYYGGTPVANVQVRAQATTGGTIYSTTTHGDGEYRFDSMPAAKYIVKAAPFGSLKQKTIIVSNGSDATGVDFWANGNPFQSTNPTVAIFTINTVAAGSISLSQWGYDVESSLDSIKIRIGTTLGATDVYPDTELVTESTAATISGFTLQPNTSYYLRATYTDGAGLSTTVDRTISFSAATVTGTVTLQDYSGAMMPLTVEVRNHGSSSDLNTYTVTPDSGGHFSFLAPPPGSYDFAFKAVHWLKRLVANVTVTGGGASGLTPSLINGDIDGNNAVGLSDFAQLKAAFGSLPGNSNWNANADLDGNGAVGLSDFAILKRNFGLIGDP